MWRCWGRETAPIFHVMIRDYCILQTAQHKNVNVELVGCLECRIGIHEVDVFCLKFDLAWWVATSDDDHQRLPMSTQPHSSHSRQTKIFHNFLLCFWLNFFRERKSYRNGNVVGIVVAVVDVVVSGVVHVEKAYESLIAWPWLATSGIVNSHPQMPFLFSHQMYSVSDAECVGLMLWGEEGSGRREPGRNKRLLSGNVPRKTIRDRLAVCWWILRVFPKYQLKSIGKALSFRFVKENNGTSGESPKKATINNTLFEAHHRFCERWFDDVSGAHFDIRWHATLFVVKLRKFWIEISLFLSESKAVSLKLA